MSRHTPSPETLFAAAVRISASFERRAYPDRVCAGNPALLEEVESTPNHQMRLEALQQEIRRGRVPNDWMWTVGKEPILTTH